MQYRLDETKTVQSQYVLNVEYGHAVKDADTLKISDDNDVQI